MHRTVAIALVLATIVAGCVATPAADVETASTLPAAIPALLTAEGAAIEAVVGGVLLTWEDVVRQGPPGGLNGAAVPQPLRAAIAEFPLGLPPEAKVLRGTLTWDAPVSVTFRILNEDGVSFCGGVMPEDGQAECFATLYAERDAPAEWLVRVTPSGNAVQPSDIPFKLDLFIGTDALPMLGLPAPFGESAAAQFSVPVLLSDDDTHTAEPSIAVTPDGIIYVAAPVSAQRALWRSDDGGATFTEVIVHAQPTDPLSQYPQGGGDSDVAVSGERTVYFADQHAGGETVSASHDGGATWFTQPLGAVPAADRQWLVTDGEMTAWLGYNSLAGATVSKTLDGGRTWPIKATIEGDNCFRGNLVRAPDGTLYLAGCDDEGPGVGVSTDGGLTFTWRNVAKRSGETNTSFVFPAHLFVIATTDSEGNAYVVWSDEAQKPEDTGAPEGPHGLNVWLASSTDQGETWSMPKRVNTPDGTYVLPWATASAPGRGAVSYYGTKFVGHPERALGEWYPILAVTEDALAPTPVFHESAMTDQVMQYGPVCMRGSACGNARNLLDFFQIQADSEGMIHAAYIDGTDGGNYRYANIVYGKQTGGLGLGGRSVDKDGGVTGFALPKIPVG